MRDGLAAASSSHPDDKQLPYRRQTCRTHSLLAARTRRNFLSFTGAECIALSRKGERVAVGLNADEIVHSLLDVRYAKKPYTTIQRAMHIHPTVTELIPTLRGDLKPLA